MAWRRSPAEVQVKLVREGASQRWALLRRGRRAALLYWAREAQKGLPSQGVSTNSARYRNCWGTSRSNGQAARGHNPEFVATAQAAFKSHEPDRAEGIGMVAYEPNTCLTSNGLSAMSFALPRAIGAKLAEPGRRVLAGAGYGAFLMNSQEIETALRERIP